MAYALAAVAAPNTGLSSSVRVPSCSACAHIGEAHAGRDAADSVFHVPERQRVVCGWPDGSAAGFDLRNTGDSLPCASNLWMSSACSLDALLKRSPPAADAGQPAKRVLMF